MPGVYYLLILRSLSLLLKTDETSMQFRVHSPRREINQQIFIKPLQHLDSLLSAERNAKETQYAVLAPQGLTL